MDKDLIILIVEDEALIATWLKMELEMAGLQVCGLSASGEEAIRMTGQYDPDVILMDVFLQGKMTGVEAVEKIRTFSKAAIIFMTGYHEDHISKSITDLEPAGILIKPVKPDNVVEILKKL